MILHLMANRLKTNIGLTQKSLLLEKKLSND